MFCVSCGKEVGAADQFCGGCGSKTVQPVPAQSQQYVRPVYQPPPGYGHQQHGASVRPAYQPPVPASAQPAYQLPVPAPASDKDDLDGDTVLQAAYVLKAKKKALLLCIFLGWYGGHRFYVGKIGSAIGMLALGILYAVLYIASFFDPGGLIYAAGVVAIPLFMWWLADLINICVNKFADKNGRSLQKG